MSILWSDSRSEELSDVTESVPGIGISGESPATRQLPIAHYPIRLRRGVRAGCRDSFGSSNERYCAAEPTPGRIQQPTCSGTRIRITVLFSACFRLSQDYSPKVRPIGSNPSTPSHRRLPQLHPVALRIGDHPFCESESPSGPSERLYMKPGPSPGIEKPVRRTVPHCRRPERRRSRSERIPLLSSNPNCWLV